MCVFRPHQDAPYDDGASTKLVAERVANVSTVFPQPDPFTGRSSRAGVRHGYEDVTQPAAK